MADLAEQKRVPYPPNDCLECLSLFGQLGDRDAEVRDLQRQLARSNNAAIELAAVVQALDQAGIPPGPGKPNERSTVARRVSIALERGRP